MNLPLREGISLNLSFLHLSDVLVILLVLVSHSLTYCQT